VSLGRAGAPNHGMPPAIRGAVLVGLLVVVGIVGLQVLDDSSPSGSSVVVTTSTVSGQTTVPGATTTAPAATATTKPAATATTKPTSTTKATTSKSTATTTVTTKKPADIKVVVYNASGVSQLAENMSNQLKSVGYNASVGGNLTQRTGTIVQCKAGMDVEATKLANDGVGKGASVTPYPAHAPTGAGDADCIVTLGKSS
jgi:hypothetical protein